MSAPARFVKSASTGVPVARSRAELERLLVRYGCSRFQVFTDFEAGAAAVTFSVPDSLAKGALTIPVRLEVDSRRVYDAIYGKPRTGTYDDRWLAQADRIAWRQLILWVDAALSAASAGVQTIAEAFFAHTLVQGRDGTTRRMADEVAAVAGGNWRALLAAPKETS
jgi:hypothetical protein